MLVYERVNICYSGQPQTPDCCRAALIPSQEVLVGAKALFGWWMVIQMKTWESMGKQQAYRIMPLVAIGSHLINVPGVFVQLAILTKGFGWFWGISEYIWYP